MTPRAHILARLGEGAAAPCDIAALMHTECGAAPSEMYVVAYRECKALIDEGLIEKHVCGAYQLTGSTPMEPKDESAPTKTRAPKPKKFGNLTEAKRLAPIPEKA